MKISVLLPFFNEEKQIPLTLEAVEQALIDLPTKLKQKPENLSYEIICIDDGSSDRTGSVLATEAAKRPGLKILYFSRNFGKEAAICAGLDAVSGDCAILMDGDLQHPPSYFPTMVNLWQQGYEVVEGVKQERQNESRFSRWAANLFYGLFHRLGGLELKNASDFKLLDKKVVMAWQTLNERETFFRGLSAWLGFKRTSFEFEVADRTVGQGKWKLKNLLKLSITAITSFSARPLHLIAGLGLICLVGSFILMIQTLVRFFMGRAAGGFTTVILLQLLIGGAIMLSLGLIGIYLGRIYDEIKGRPRYLIRDVRESAADGQVTSAGQAGLGLTSGQVDRSEVISPSSDGPD